MSKSSPEVPSLPLGRCPRCNNSFKSAAYAIRCRQCSKCYHSQCFKSGTTLAPELFDADQSGRFDTLCSKCNETYQTKLASAELLEAEYQKLQYEMKKRKNPEISTSASTDVIEELLNSKIDKMPTAPKSKLCVTHLLLQLTPPRIVV